MKYVILHMIWNVAMHSKQVIYDVSEFSAILLDEELHTTDTFRFIKEQENGYVKSEEHFEKSKVLITNLENGWKAFCKWIDSEAILVVWDKNIITAIRYCNGICKKRKIHNKIVILSKLYQSMTIKIPKDKNGIATVMKALGLKCENQNLQYSIYVTKTMVRMFRKLYMAGKQEMGATFVHGLIEGDYFYIAQHTFFEDLELKAKKDRNAEIKALFQQNSLICNISQNTIKVQSKSAQWILDIESNEGSLYYYTNKFYKGVRKESLQFTKKMEFQEKVQLIIEKIAEVENQFSYGVGNKEITILVEKLCR